MVGGSALDDMRQCEHPAFSLSVRPEPAVLERFFIWGTILSEKSNDFRDHTRERENRGCGSRCHLPGSNVTHAGETMHDATEFWAIRVPACSRC